jgi:hypothetical protein
MRKGKLAVTPFAEDSRRGDSEVADCVVAEIRYGTVRGSLAVGCCMTLYGPVDNVIRSTGRGWSVTVHIFLDFV